MPDYRALAQALGTSQPTPQEIERMAALQSPAFGVFPQMQPYRSQQDITASANVPVDVLRGRIAGTRGLFGDVVNQPIPMVRPLQLLSQAFTGQQKYPDTEHYLETMPLKSNTPIGDVAGKIGSFAPINPMPAVKGYLSLLGNEINAGMTGQPTRSVIGQMTPKPLQIFIGENAKTWDKEAAKTAVEMEKAGAKPEDIWSATGTFRGAEGKLRQEISDKYSTIKGGGSFEDVIMNAYDRGVERTRGTGQREYWQPYKTTVDDVLFHHNLSEAYPELMKIESQLTPNETGSKGQLMLTDKDLIMQIRPDLQGTQAESTMLHELQHGVQEKEGFAKGGSPDLMVLTLEKLAKQKREEAQKMFDLSSNKDPLNPQIIKPGARAKGLELEKEARLIQDQVSIAYHSEKAKYDLYKKLAGEAEARAVQSRMNMTDAERRAKFPYESYDVPINELIVKK